MCYRCNVTENVCVIAVMGERTYVLQVQCDGERMCYSCDGTENTYSMAVTSQRIRVIAGT